MMKAQTHRALRLLSALFLPMVFLLFYSAPSPGCGAAFAQAAMAPADAQPAQEYEITLMAVGDNLMHMGVVYAGRQADGSLDYAFLFEGISDLIQAADIRIINQETILGGNERGFSGFPLFNSPTQVGDAIAGAGFNVVLHATNHSADQKLSGIDSCVSFWNTAHPETLLTGIHAPLDGTEPPESRIPLLPIKGITFAVLNYTYGPNYGSSSQELSSRLNILCAVDEKSRKIDFTTLNPQVLSDIRLAETLADVVIVCPHWGTENATVPSNYQRLFAQQMTEAGADLILGTHPHVVQPVEWVVAENGNFSLCYYSLGNYVSTMKSARNMLEAMAWVTFRVTPAGTVIVPEKTGALPLVCHYTSGPVRVKRVYPLEEYSADLASAHGIIQYGGVHFSYDDLVKWSAETLGPCLLQKGQILTPPAAADAVTAQ